MLSRNFKVGTQVTVSREVTTIYTINTYCLEIGNEFHVDSELAIANITWDTEHKDCKVEGTHKEVLAAERYDNKQEAVNAYHVLVLKAYVKIAAYDKNACNMSEEMEILDNQDGKEVIY